MLRDGPRLALTARMNRMQPWPDDTDYEANPGANAPSDEWLTDMRAAEERAWADPVERERRMLSTANTLHTTALELTNVRRTELRRNSRAARGNRTTVRDVEGNDVELTDVLRMEFASQWAHEARRIVASGRTVPKLALAENITGLARKAARACIVIGLSLNGDGSLWRDGRGRKSKRKIN